MKPRPPLHDMNWIGASLSEHVVETRGPWLRVVGQAYAQVYNAMFLPLVASGEPWATIQAVAAAVGARV